MLRIGHAVWLSRSVRTSVSKNQTPSALLNRISNEKFLSSLRKSASVSFSSAIDETNNNEDVDKNNGNNSNNKNNNQLRHMLNKQDHAKKGARRQNNHDHNERNQRNRFKHNNKNKTNEVASFGERVRQIRQQNKNSDDNSLQSNPSRRQRQRNNKSNGKTKQNDTSNSLDKSNVDDDKDSSIESLRAVFLKSVELDRERREKEMERQRFNSQNKSLQSSRNNSRDSILFKTLAGDRKRRTQQSSNDDNNSRRDNNFSWRENENNSSRQNWRSRNSENNAANGSNDFSSAPLSPREQYLAYQQTRQDFFETRIEEERKPQHRHRSRQKRKNDSQEQRQIILSNHVKEIDLRTLAGILRVKIEDITKTLIALGELDASVLETPPKADFVDKRGKTKPKKKVKESLVSVGDRKIDITMAELVSMELGFDVTITDDKNAAVTEAGNAALIGRRNIDISEYSDEDEITEKSDAKKNLFTPRAPVVSIMGHVDHGKTTLMDALRRRSNLDSSNQQGKKNKKNNGNKLKNGQASSKANGGDVAGTEAGGITQVISAFEVPIKGMEVESSFAARNSVTFLDTPGHAAFKSMRQSGSNATDIIVLVVAADDGVSAQTVEIIDMYKRIEKESGGNISLLVAMTKIDKNGVNIDESIRRIENQLMEHNIYSNDVQLVPVSGLTGEGLDDLVEALVLQAQVMDLRADLEARGEGVVMDSKIEKGMGVVIDCVVRWGKLERGDVIVSGTHMGKVKILTDVNGKTLKKAIASQPVRLVGLKSLPKAGDPIICVEDEEKAKEIIELRLAANEEANLHRTKAINTGQDDLQITGSAAKGYNTKKRMLDRYGLDFSNLDSDEDVDDDGPIYIPIVIKADADGSLDAVKESLVSIGTMCEKYDINIDPIEASIGNITASDLLLAKESQAAIFSFGVKGGYDKKAAEEAGVTIRQHEVIYSLLDDAKDIFAGYLPLVEADKVHGRAVVQAVFTLNNKTEDKIAGLRVRDGLLLKEKCPDTGLECRFRVLRNGSLVSSEGGLLAHSLRKVKEDVQNVKKGEECGLGLESFSDLEEGDVIECFSTEMKKASI